MLADEEDTSSLEDDDVVVLDGMDEGLRKSTWRLIASVALPASLANASPVLLTTAQTALLGHGKGGAVALAAYGSVSTTISLATRVSTFLTDATSAKCGLAVGQRDWRRLAESIRGSLAWAVALGLISVLLLYAAKPFVFARLLSLRGDVLRDAEEYWVFAVGKLPFQLVNLSISGGLQGFGPERVRLVALISTLAAAVELLVDCVVVYVGGSGGASLLWKFGLVGLVVAALQAGAGMALLLTVKPVEAGDDFSLTARLTDNDAMAAEDDEDDEDDARVVLKDGMVDMLVRSLVMQGSFLVALVAVSRLDTPPTDALAAHHIVTNVWMIQSYIVDGLAAAAIVIGSRLRASGSSALLSLTARCIGGGGGVGCVIAAGLIFGRDQVIRFYVGGNHTEAVRELLASVWMLLAVAQPVNGVVFVLDGLLCAGSDFRYISKCYVVGFALVFLPLMCSQLNASLLGVWTAKSVFNVYRLGAAILWVRRDLLSLTS